MKKLNAKKLVSLLAILSLMLATFAGCGNPASSTTAPDNTPTQQEDSTSTPDDKETKPSADTTAGSFDNFARPVVVKDRALKVGYLVRSLSGEIHQRFLRQVEIDADHYGWDLITVVYEQDNALRENWLNLINQGVDAIIVGNANTFEQYEDLATQTRNAGIGLYCIDNQVIPGVIVNTTVQNGTAMLELMYKIGADYDWNFNYTVMVEEGILVTRERSRALVGFDRAYPNEILLATQDIAAAPTSVAQAGYDFASTWIQQYGEELDILFTTSDYHATTAAEGIIASGDPKGEKWITTGIDGGSQAWAYIRNDTPLKYTYSQPAEAYAHNTCECVQQIQVEGLNPGDADCIIEKSGQVVYSDGVVTTIDNCPEVGATVHKYFDYYDPEDTDAWYTWDDGKGQYVVEEYQIGAENT
ncbi:hypothetical protein NE562_10680 [Butyricicoccus faecihominis]|uniref:sugar ABC transporter substrate-binding protein n=1 Tax=Butyricicoccus faecihominis TaxID=1712515 RepID=UPI00247B0676|nr:hypothetical protein [Butyricicoccus faecihominis]MCQ5130127.1 hypothetical protein [Butyricicoccus faecihominis]